MKTISNDYKTNVKEFGREIDSILTYELNGETIELGTEDLNSVTPSFQADILKSVMKQLDIDSNVEIPEGTIINYQFGVKVDDEYEYIDYGNYVVYKVEKQEDTSSYKITCYDKMLYSMKDYETIGVTYPITVRDYLTALCTYLGLTFANSSDTNFANWNRQIQTELYLDANGNSIGYTFRDVFDELSQVTASTICINADDEVEIRYINDTNDTINEEYLKDINVNFGDKYGRINSIVLTRGESDSVYLRDEQSVAQNGLCEIKIKDNQIMNFNDRSDYLPDILAKLDGLEYYLNDYASTGITYYDVCDRYNIEIGENTYSCIMFNDEVVITQGLEENVHTDMPEESETDYTKADKTDRKINQTYFIVDKQNQTIQSVVNTVSDQNEQISSITQTVSELNQKISDIADVTITGETAFASFELDGINASEPIMIKIHPTVNNISYLYPRSNLYPANSLYSTNRILRFTNTKKYIETLDNKYQNYKSYFSYDDETYEYTLLVEGTDYNNGDTITGTIYEYKYIDYVLPDDLLVFDSDTYDEFYLDYDSQTCQVIKRCGYNADGTVYQLAQEHTDTYTYPTIMLGDGDYTISLLGYEYGYLFTRLMASNIYTSQFATKVEMNSAINQKANEISLVVNEKLDEEDFTHASIVAKINDDTSQVQIEADKISLAGKTIDMTAQDVVITSSNFQVDANGNMSASNANITGGELNLTGNDTSPKFQITNASDATRYMQIYPSEIRTWKNNVLNFRLTTLLNTPILGLFSVNDDYTTTISSRYINLTDGTNTTVITPTTVTPGSLEKNKKNIVKYNNALKDIKKTDIYEYHYISEDDNRKKHIGFVIGDKYNYSHKITGIDEEGKEIGADLYSMISVCMQAIKEQQEIIEKLQQEIKDLKNEK